MAILWLVLGLCLTAEVFAMPDKTNLWLGPHVAPKGAHSTPKEPSPSRKAPGPSPKAHSPSPSPIGHGPGPSPSPKAHSPSPRPKGPSPKAHSPSPRPKGPSPKAHTRADMLPYGIDTPDHRPTGRFSNGLNIPDIISEYIGSEPTLPYLSPELDGQKLLVGANFASAGVGILNDTGSQFILRHSVLKHQRRLVVDKDHSTGGVSAEWIQTCAKIETSPLIWPTIEENEVTKTKKYAKLSAAEKIQADCDMKATNIILQGLPTDIYSLVNHHRVAKDLWERVQLLMQGDDPIACLNKAMAFLTDVASLSSGGNNASGQVKVVKCYNCQGEGHMARQCTQPKRPRNAIWGSDVPHSETYLNDMENQSVHAMYDFEQTPVVDFTDNKKHSESNIISYSQYLQETQQENVQDTNLQTQQDSMILSVIEQMSKQMINHKAQRIKPTLYDGIVMSAKHIAIPMIDGEETLILEEEIQSKMSEKEKDPEAIKQNISYKPIDYEKLNRLSNDFGKRFTPQQELSTEQAFWLRMSNPTSKPSDASPVKIEAPKELPKIRTTHDARTEGEWGFEHTKAVFNNDIIPFLKSLIDIFNVFDRDLLNEIMEVHIGHVFTEVGLKWKPTGRTFTIVGNSCPLTRITLANVMPSKKTTSHSVETQKPELKVYSRKPKNVKNIGSSKKAKIVEFKNANHLKPNHTWGSNATDIPSSSSLVMIGVDLLFGSRDTNLYTISLDDMLKTSLICILSKASKTKSWLFHHRLLHLNFGTLNKLAKDGLSRGIPRLKFQKDHLCSACALGKSKKYSHQRKPEDTNQEKLYLLRMDLCGPMRVASINEKSSGPGLHSVTPATSSSALIPNTGSQQPCIPPNSDYWDHLFQPMFDEYFTPPSIVVSLVPVVAAPRAVDLADSRLSTSNDQDDPSTSIPSTQEQEHSPNISQSFKESPKTPTFCDDPLHQSLHEDSNSQGSSSNVQWIQHSSHGKQEMTYYEHLLPLSTSLSGNETGIDKIHLSHARILWSISRRNKMFWHTARDDTMFTSMRCISRHEKTQVYGVILLKELTNQAMLESKAYKTYHVFVWKENSKTKTKAKVAKSDNKKQPAKNPKAKGLAILSEVALTKAGYQKKQEKLSHITCNWLSNEEDNYNDDFEDDADNNDDDSDDNDESGDERTKSDSNEIPDPYKSNDEHDDKEEEEYDDEFNVEKGKNMDEVEDDEVTKELYKDVNFNLGKKDANMTDIDQSGADQKMLLNSQDSSKKRKMLMKSSKDAESSRGSKSKENKSSSISKDASQSQHKSSGKSAHAEEPSHNVEDSGMQQDQEFVMRDNNEQPTDKDVTKANWLKKPERPPTPDPDWSDFKRLRLQDIEDMLLLLIQQRLTNLTIDERNKIAYTSYSDPYGIIYVDQNRRKRLMRIDELHKFSDGTLNDVQSTLHDIAAGIRMEYLPMRK
uniref:GDSL esterase/lipase n=1 Tax=Tanacetum cinerariifolium TaxID=118510 RepID=A0A6L2NGS5_TANCI|nr:GDSL esterase/lipase [Tanacetum cinerariifolium]